MRALHTRGPLRAASGVSLLEIAFAIGLVAALVGVVAGTTGRRDDGGHAGQVVQTVESLRRACASYRIDTCSFATELTGHAAMHRQLSANPGVAGWHGPYLETPLSGAQNPWGGRIDLYDDVRANGWIQGFDLDGNGELDAQTEANMLVLEAVPAPGASAIDAALERGAPGEWMASGRVRYDALAQRLYVLVLP
ncbi:MAG: hypothetical protein EPO68_16900 [Planctomycetota bacterium]|nr:MAG: hypothetical protein EPO68_16900 [Planctomycetota bacterium]